MNTATMPNKFFAIDTLQFAKRMQKAGLDQKIAEELAEAIKETQSQSIDALATKEDLKEIEQNSKQEARFFEETQKHDIMILRQDLKILENEIYVRVGRMIYISTAFITTIIGLAVAVIKF